ncbi:uncharacterized protein LOC143186959 [Calliopsis andreniformis]|uniref:uncharacterized protein LOC143186959 n=1 Tax=Calliopsis andreniformis TaxID=337506 RepID=UPI003FCDF6CB
MLTRRQHPVVSRCQHLGCKISECWIREIAITLIVSGQRFLIVRNVQLISSPRFQVFDSGISADIGFCCPRWSHGLEWEPVSPHSSSLTSEERGCLAKFAVVLLVLGIMARFNNMEEMIDWAVDALARDEAQVWRMGEELADAILIDDPPLGEDAYDPVSPGERLSWEENQDGEDRLYWAEDQLGPDSFWDQPLDIEDPRFWEVDTVYNASSPVPS